MPPLLFVDHNSGSKLGMLSNPGFCNKKDELKQIIEEEEGSKTLIFTSVLDVGTGGSPWCYL